MEIDDFKSEIIKLARKFNLEPSQIKAIYSHQFKLIANKIRKDFEKPIDERQSIRVQGLGTFNFNPYIAKKINEYKDNE
jgi:hypothetical protein